MDQDVDAPSSSSSIEQLYSRDIVLRSPLDPRLLLRRGDSRPRSSVIRAHSGHKQHDARLRPKLSALLVGASVLQLQVETIFTAAVLLHRYYAVIHDDCCEDEHKSAPAAAASSSQQQQQQQHHATQQQQQQQQKPSEHDDDDWKYVVAVCLFLACKREEEPRRLRDVINVAHMMDCNSNNNSTQQQQQERSIVVVTWNPTPPLLDASYWAAKQRMVQTEQRVLRWLTLDVAVPHPHRAVVHLLLTYLNDGDDDSDDDNDNNSQQQQQRFQHLVRASVRRVNDSIYSSAALQQPVLALAVAAVQLAILEENRKVEEEKVHTCWWTADRYRLDIVTLNSVPAAIQCLQDATESLTHS